MGRTLSCDIHPNKDNFVSENEGGTIPVTAERWFKVNGKNVLFHNKVDECMACMTETIVQRAKALGIDVEKNWKTTIWRKGKSGKSYPTHLSMDEYIQYLKDEELEELRKERLIR